VKLTFKSDSTEGSAQSTKFQPNKTDTTKGDAVFKAQDFATLKSGQAYIVVLTTQDGTTINTTATFTPGQTPDAGTLTCDKPSGTTVTCNLVGKNLKSVTQVKLAPASGSSIASSKVEPNVSDDTKATATFTATDFATLKSDQKYSIVLVSGGKDIKTSAEFSPSSTTTEVPDATALNCTVPGNKTASVTCRLVGKSLQDIKQVNLVPKSGKTISSSKFDPNAADHTKATVTFTGSDYSSLSKGQPYSITLVPATGQDVNTKATYKP
jgi:hypothetical protein